MSEKVFSNGKWYTRDCPHEIISPRIMRFEEIRWWLRELSTNPAYGWYPGGVAGLARALGMAPGGTLQHKLTTAWIWPKEQVRLTGRITDIRNGYIVPRRFGIRVEGVYTDPPEPPNVPVQRSIRLVATPGKISLAAQDLKPRSRMPSFHRAFAEAIPWNPDAKKGGRSRPS